MVKDDDGNPIRITDIPDLLLEKLTPHMELLEEAGKIDNVTAQQCYKFVGVRNCAPGRTAVQFSAVDDHRKQKCYKVVDVLGHQTRSTGRSSRVYDPASL